MRFLIVRTEIRAAADNDLAAVWAGGGLLRDERTAPEFRRQTVHAEDRDAALLLARALSTVGAVRAGRQRVKVVPVGEPGREPHLRQQSEPQAELTQLTPGSQLTQLTQARASALGRTSP